MFILLMRGPAAKICIASAIPTQYELKGSIGVHSAAYMQENDIQKDKFLTLTKQSYRQEILHHTS